MTTPPPPYPGQDPNAPQYPGQDPYAQQPYQGQPYPGQPYQGQPYPEQPQYQSQQPFQGQSYPGQPQYPAPDQQPYAAQDPNAAPYPGQDPNAPQPAYAALDPNGQPYPPPDTPAITGLGDVKPRSKSTRWFGIIVAILVVGGFGVYRFIDAQHSPQKAQVGDCISYASETEVSIVGCDSAKAQYLVETRVDSSSPTACDSVDDSDIQLFSKDDDSAKQFSLCVSLVLHEGDCISTDGEEVACDSPDVMGKVTSIHQGTSDPSVCAAGESGRPYTLRPRVVCVAVSS